MSDFLSQFDKDNYTKNAHSQPAPPHPAQPEASIVEPRHQAAIQGPAHETVIDKSFHRNKIIKTLIIALTVVAVCVAGVLLFRVMNQIEIKALVGGSLNEAKNWALKNRVDFNITEEFNLENDKDIVITQNPEQGIKIQKGSVMNITVSKGPDPDEILKLPDFTNINTAGLREWISKNKAFNINVIQEYSETAEAGAFIKTEFRDDLINESNYTRKDIMAVYMSRGIEPQYKNITVPDFKEKTKMDVETWAAANNIAVTYEEKGSDSVPKGSVISQSITPGEKLAANDEIEIVVSKGAGVTVPNFSNILRDNAEVSGLTVIVQSKYSVSVPYGRLISQSVKAGTVFYGENNSVTATYSEGRPYIDDLVGRPEKDLPVYFYEFEKKGAKITYSVTYVDSIEPKGNVVSASIKSEFVGMSLNVKIEISRGNLKPPPIDSEPPPDIGL